VKFESTDIGGKEHESVQFVYTGDVAEARKYTSLGRTVLGELKASMSFNKLSQGVLERKFDHGDTTITASSIIAGVPLADIDKVEIDVSVGGPGKSIWDMIIGFTVHYKALTPHFTTGSTQYINLEDQKNPIFTGNLGENINTFFSASEPYGTSGNGLGYLSIEKLNNLSGASQLNQEFNPAGKGDEYTNYPKSGDYIDDYRTVPGTIGVIENGDSTNYGEHYPFIKALKTPYGLYMIEKAAFNHVDKKYRYYEEDFRAKAACHPFKDVHEKTQILMPLTDDIANFGPYEIVGDLDVEAPKKFLDGWYGFGVGNVCSVARKSKLVFVFELLNYGALKYSFEFDIPITNPRPPFNQLGVTGPTSNYFMLNMTLGLLLQFDEPITENPFYKAYPSSGVWDMVATLQKPFDNTIKPKRLINLNEDLKNYLDALLTGKQNDN
jgi:hypothetical protein